MSEREEMLERIRKALGRPPGGLAETPRQAPTTEMGAVLPPILPEELLPKFEAEWDKVGGSAYRVATAGELEKVIHTILETSQATNVVLSHNPLLWQLRFEERLRAWGISVAIWPTTIAEIPRNEASAFREACFEARVGITGVDFALAESGSLVLSSQTEGSQLASLAPPVHVALYRRSQLVGSLDEVLEKLAISRDPSLPAPGRAIVFITGPSRTADIEQILVRGVHGPGDVHAILVEEACLV